MTAHPYTIDPTIERLLHIGQLPDLFERFGMRRPHKNNVRRWLTTGTRGVVIPSVLVGGKRYTTQAAVQWWIATSTAAKPLGG